MKCETMKRVKLTWKCLDFHILAPGPRPLSKQLTCTIYIYLIHTWKHNISTWVGFPVVPIGELAVGQLPNPLKHGACMRLWCELMYLQVANPHLYMEYCLQPQMDDLWRFFRPCFIAGGCSTLMNFNNRTIRVACTHSRLRFEHGGLKAKNDFVLRTHPCLSECIIEAPSRAPSVPFPAFPSIFQHFPAFPSHSATRSLRSLRCRAL